MANIKSAKKRIIISNKKNKINSKLRSRMKNQIKNCINSIEKKLETNNTFLKNTISLISKMSNKGLLHKKNSSRKISNLQIKYNKYNKKNNF